MSATIPFFSVHFLVIYNHALLIIDRYNYYVLNIHKIECYKYLLYFNLCSLSSSQLPYIGIIYNETSNVYNGQPINVDTSLYDHGTN